MQKRVTFAIILAALATTAAGAQQAAKVCSDGRTIEIVSQWDHLSSVMAPSDAAAVPLRYSISSTRGVQGAWIEVWDRPKRLSRKAVSVKREGQAPCTRCEAADQTPDGLRISIFDPEEPLICMEGCPGGRWMGGAYVSEVQVGKKTDEDPDESVEPAYLMDYPVLTGTPIRILEGSGNTNVLLSGENLLPSSRVHLDIGGGALPNREAPRNYLESRVLDLRHVRATVPAELLDKPAVLVAQVSDSWEREARKESGQKIVVASKSSPVVDSVEPRELPYGGLDATVVLRGNGFTERSEVEFSDDQILYPEVTFVSPNELSVKIRAGELSDTSGRYARATPLELSVTNDPLQFSAPVALRVLPSAKFKREPRTAMVTAVAPFPVPMMDFHSPRFLALEIYGENFRPNDVVSFRLEDDNEYRRLKTRYASPQHLTAWLPHESWRKHRLSFRLVVQTSEGLCAAEAFAEYLE